MRGLFANEDRKNEGRVERREEVEVGCGPYLGPLGYVGQGGPRIAARAEPRTLGLDTPVIVKRKKAEISESKHSSRKGQSTGGSVRAQSITGGKKAPVCNGKEHNSKGMPE